MPGKVLSRPRFLIRMKFGSVVKIGGTISAVRNRKKTLSRPGQREPGEGVRGEGAEEHLADRDSVA